MVGRGSGPPLAPRANISRTVARRCERRILALKEQGIAIDPQILTYINRLSDFLFVLSRAINNFNGIEEIFWEKSC